MKYFSLFISFLIVSISCSNTPSWVKYQSNQFIDDDFNHQLNQFILHTNNGDASKMYDFFIPEVKSEYFKYPNIKTEKDIINLLDSINTSMNDKYEKNGYEIKMENLGIRDRYECNGDLIFTAEYILIFKPTINIKQNNYILGISNNKGKTWKFVEISRTAINLFSKKYGKNNIEQYLGKLIIPIKNTQ